MSGLADVIRKAVNDSLSPSAVFGDSYTVTNTPHGTAVTHSVKAVPDTDLKRHRDNGLTVNDGDQVLILFAATAPSLTAIDPGDYIEGPSDAAHRDSLKMAVTDVQRDSANATWIVSAGT